MTEKKKQLGNIAFGGNWSEELLITETLKAVFETIGKATRNCADRDVDDEDLRVALRYVYRHVEKGPLLCEAYFKALREEDPGLRQQEAGRIEQLMINWAGL